MRPESQITPAQDDLQKRIQPLEAELTEAKKELTEEKAAYQKLKKERDEFQRRVSELQAQLKAYERNAKTESSTSDLPSLYENNISMTFVLIPKGRFQMGSNYDVDNEKPVHQVTIGQPFYLGKYGVTQDQWKQVMGSENNPSEFKGDKLPVTNVSWQDTQEFIQKLNANGEGDTYRLLTEAEWEYAARAGTTTAYSFGDDPGLLDKYGWYEGNSGRQTHPVGQLEANPWGLHDMHGNVWEWVQDWYGKYPSDHQTDPKGPKNGDSRGIRGGSFIVSSLYLRSARRVRLWPGFRLTDLGFRCVCVPSL